MSSIRSRYLQSGIGHKNLNLTRSCVVCGRPAFGLGELCSLHRHRRNAHGHPKVRQGLLLKEWRPILPAVLRFMKANPPSAEVLASVGRLIAPGNAPAPTVSRLHPRRLLYEELASWQRPESRKSASAKRWNYSPRGILARLVAAQIVIEEQERRFPGASPEIELAHTIAMMFRRPRRASGLRRKRICGSVLRGLAERIKASGVVGVYLLQSARAIIKLRAEQEATKATLPRKPGPPPTTIWTPPAPPSRASLLAERYGIKVHHS